MNTTSRIHKKLMDLLQNGELTIEEALAKSDLELMQYRNIGRKTIEYLRQNYGQSTDLSKDVMKAVRVAVVTKLGPGVGLEEYDKLEKVIGPVVELFFDELSRRRAMGRL